MERVKCVKNSGFIKYYRLIERFHILISNREALNFLGIGVAICLLFGVTPTVLTLKQSVTAEYIYAVITYLWTFAISLDDAPRLMEELSKLKDIGKRVEAE